MTLISDYSERMARAAEKKQKVLRFLQSETYSTNPIIAELLQVSRSAASKTLQSLEREELIRKHTVNHSDKVFYIITDHGATEDVEPDQKVKYFRGISEARLHHKLELQRVRVNTKLTDWIPENWLPGQGLPKTSPQRWAVYPDALAKAVRGDGTVLDIAIELERTRKHRERYPDVIRKHQKNIEIQRYQHVMYFCPSEKFRDSLSALINEAMIKKRLGNMHDYFSFYSYPFK